MLSTLLKTVLWILIATNGLCQTAPSTTSPDTPTNLTKTAPKYTLKFFNGRWRGEAARLIFAQAGVPYNDVRISSEEWPKLKPKTPFGRLPVLEFDGHELAESFAINRFLARQFGLAGANSVEEAFVDSVADFHNDFFHETGKALVSAFTLYKDTIAPARDLFLPPLSRMLKEANSGYLVGKSVTWADLMITEYLYQMQTVFANFFHGFPEVEEYVDRVRSLPRIKKWIEERPGGLNAPVKSKKDRMLKQLPSKSQSV